MLMSAEPDLAAMSVGDLAAGGVERPCWVENPRWLSDQLAVGAMDQWCSFPARRARLRQEKTIAQARRLCMADSVVSVVRLER